MSSDCGIWEKNCTLSFINYDPEFGNSWAETNPENIFMGKNEPQNQTWYVVWQI